jgi:hypothetical protein
MGMTYRPSSDESDTVYTVGRVFVWASKDVVEEAI